MKLKSINNLEITVFLVFCSLLTILIAIKWLMFLYNALDLAIFSQTFFQLVSNHSTFNTIQNSFYLGDHFSILLVILYPIAYISSHPITFLLLQTLALGSSIFCLSLILKNKGNKLLWYLLFISSPFVLNVALFEFHFIAFLIPLFFLLWHFYTKKQFLYFISVFIFALLIREDISFILIGFPLLSLIEKRSWKWSVSTFLLCVLALFGTQYIVSMNSIEGSYKFLSYYHYMGNTWQEILQTIFFKPWVWIKHLLSFNQFVMFMLMFLPFLFLCFKKPKFLLFILFPYLQFALTEAGGGNLIIQLHYGTLFFAPLFLATIYAVESIKNNKALYYLLLFTVNIYFMITITPTYNLITKAIQNDEGRKNNIVFEVIKSLPEDASIISSDAYLPYLSQRERLYEFNYTFLGVKQLSEVPYIVEEAQYALIDVKDILELYLRNNNVWYAKYSAKGPKHFQEILEKNALVPTLVYDEFILFEKTNNSIPMKPVTQLETMAKDDEIIVFIPQSFLNNEGNVLEFTFINTEGERQKKYRPIKYSKVPLLNTYHSFSNKKEVKLIDVSIGKAMGGVYIGKYANVTHEIESFIPNKTLYFNTL